MSKKKTRKDKETEPGGAAEATTGAAAAPSAADEGAPGDEPASAAPPPTAAAPPPAPRRHKGHDAWTQALPSAVHWVLTFATLGLWAVVWRGAAERWIPAVLSGVMLFLSFAGFDIWPLGFVFVVPMLHLIDRCETGKQAWWWSWFSGWIANFGGFYWISGLLIDFGHMPWPLATFICLGLCLLQALSFATFGRVMWAIRSRAKWPTVLLAPIVWVAAELVLPMIFPFYLGNSQYNALPMIQSAELLGPLLVSAVLFVSNGAIYDLIYTWRHDAAGSPARRRAFIGAGVGAALVALNLVYGFVRIGQVEAEQQAAETLRIGMVEANIGIWEKEAPDKIANNHTIHQNLSMKLVQEEKVDLIVWPESSWQVPLIFASREKTDDVERLRATAEASRRFLPKDATWIAPSTLPPAPDIKADEANKTPPADRFALQRGHTTPMIVGGISFRPLSDEELRTNPPHKKMRVVENGEAKRVPRNFRVYNSAVMVDTFGRIQGIYDKNYLLAFGESVPGADWWPWVYDLIPEASEFTPGTEVMSFPMGRHKLGIMICYEDILPNFNRRLMETQPNVLINVTNDAWFGKTHEPYLHLALATFRSVESRRWLLRSTNTGVSAFIDATGRIVKQTSIHDPETLAMDVPMLASAPSLYMRVGDLLGWLSLLGSVVLVVLARRRVAT